MSTAESLSFDGLDALYDQTCTFDLTCSESVLDWLSARFPLRLFGSVLEPDIGTGRVALPLAGRVYQVMGLDISEE